MSVYGSIANGRFWLVGETGRFGQVDLRSVTYLEFMHAGVRVHFESGVTTDIILTDGGGGRYRVSDAFRAELLQAHRQTRVATGSRTDNSGLPQPTSA